MFSSFRVFVFVICTIAFADSLFAEATDSKYLKSTQTCHKFAQDFYNWYVPSQTKRGEAVTLKEIMTKKRDLFSGPLLEMLKEDNDAQSKAPGEIVGIDWNPFLNSQDPAEKYTVQNTDVLHDNCSAEIWSGRTISTKKPKPDIVAKLKWIDDGWKFVNFYMPDDKYPTDLISALEKLKKSREKSK